MTSQSGDGWSTRAQGQGEPPEEATSVTSTFQSSTVLSEYSEGPAYSMNNGWADSATGEAEGTLEWGPPGWSDSSSHTNEQQQEHTGDPSISPGSPQLSFSPYVEEDDVDEEEQRPPLFVTPTIATGPITGNGPLPLRRFADVNAEPQ